MVPQQPPPRLRRKILKQKATVLFLRLKVLGEGLKLFGFSIFTHVLAPVFERTDSIGTARPVEKTSWLQVPFNLPTFCQGPRSRANEHKESALRLYFPSAACRAHVAVTVAT